MCLQLDVTAGDCVKAPIVGLETKVPCGSGDLKVTGAWNGTQGETLCGKGDKVAVYPEPPLTVCLNKES